MGTYSFTCPGSGESLDGGISRMHELGLPLEECVGLGHVGVLHQGGAAQHAQIAASEVTHLMNDGSELVGKKGLHTICEIMKKNIII